MHSDECDRTKFRKHAWGVWEGNAKYEKQLETLQMAPAKQDSTKDDQVRRIIWYQNNNYECTHLTKMETWECWNNFTKVWNMPHTRVPAILYEALKKKY